MTQTMDARYAQVQRIAKAFEDKGVWVEDYYPNRELPIACIEIRGDWKHDHLRADYIAGELGLVNFGKQVTEEDGSDWYTAVHYYGLQEVCK